MVSLEDVKSHLAHGDYLGTCSTSSAITQAVSSRPLQEDLMVANRTVGVYPNPNNGIFTLQLNLFKAAKAEVLVSDARGVVVERRQVQLTGRGQILSFNLRNKAAERYLVKVISEEEVQTTKVVVQC
ncbi:MAG: T9SS type A sorting domain-containing protein [Segetibacter sp.]